MIGSIMVISAMMQPSVADEPDLRCFDDVMVMLAKMAENDQGLRSMLDDPVKSNRFVCFAAHRCGEFTSSDVLSHLNDRFAAHGADLRCEGLKDVDPAVRADAPTWYNFVRYTYRP